MKKGFFYECVIEKIGEDSIVIRDRYNSLIAISLDEIETIKGVGNGKKQN